MTRLTARLLAGSVALMLLSACTQHSTPPEAVSISSIAASSPLTHSSAPTSAGRATSTASAAAVPCDRAASGRLGQPEGGDKVLFTVRLSSYWVQSQGVVPLAVVYADGSVAVSQDNVKVSKRPVDPVLPLLGGAFSACAVQQLENEFDGFTRADFGDLRVADATEAVITRVGQTPSEDDRVVHLESADSGLSHAVLQAAQSAARRAADRWLAQVLHVTAGVRLPMDRIAVVGFRGTVPYDDTTPSMP